MECFSHSCFSESWGSPILELFVKGIGDLCAQPATARGAGGSITQGIQGHCGLSRLGGSACTVFTCSSLCLRSPSSLGVNLSNLPAELPHLGSVCRNEGLKLTADQCTGPGLRAKQGPAMPAFHKCSVSRALEILEGREVPLNPCPTLTALLGKGGACRANHLFIRDCITKLVLELVTKSG